LTPTRILPNGLPFILDSFEYARNQLPRRLILDLRGV
jgi:hypothetical protein